MSIINFLVGAAFLLALFFPIYLFLRSDWRANLAGKSMMGFSAAISIVLGLAFFRRLGYPSPEWVAVGAYLLIITVLGVQDIVLVITQRRQRRRIREERAAGPTHERIH